MEGQEARLCFSIFGKIMGSVVSKIIRVKNLLEELGLFDSSFANLYCENNVAIQIANSPMHDERTKHIEIDCHYRTDKCKNCEDCLCKVKWAASIHIYKDTWKRKHCYLLNRLGMMDICFQNVNLRGSVDL